MTMKIDPKTPVIIGVGQSLDRIDAKTYKTWSAPDLAAEAARAAALDAQARGDIWQDVEVIATTRTFEDSRPQPALFGKSSNFPRSITKRLGINPAYAVWGKAGGNSPQDLVNEFCERIAKGEFKAVLVTGAEAISTVRHAYRQGLKLDFSEDPEGQVEDRGSGLQELRDPMMAKYGLIDPPFVYAVAENARRARLGQTREHYAREMGDLFAPLAEIASKNPCSAWEVPAYTPEELVTVGAHNRWISDPYPLRLVARDQVNLGAAVLLASYETALKLGVPEQRLVYLHGYAQAAEKPFTQRPDLGASPASRAVARRAMTLAGVTPDDVCAFDFYSCFPIAVSNTAIDEFGLSAHEPRGLSVTGGLPFFGGPGNNYSMHAIAEIVAHVRKANGKPGFVGANGGYLSKYSAGVYSTKPKPWQVCESASLQDSLNAVPGIAILPTYEGQGTVESYTVVHDKGQPVKAIIMGRTPRNERFIACSAQDDQETPRKAHEEDSLHKTVTVRHEEGLNLFRF